MVFHKFFLFWTKKSLFAGISLVCYDDFSQKKGAFLMKNRLKRTISAVLTLSLLMSICALPSLGGRRRGSGLRSGNL